MAKLPTFTLAKNDKTDRWHLVNNATDRTVMSFGTKAKATRGGVLENAVGDNGGSVKIKKLNGKIQEERTYPRSADPKKSPG